MAHGSFSGSVTFLQNENHIRGKILNKMKKILNNDFIIL